MLARTLHSAPKILVITSENSDKCLESVSAAVSEMKLLCSN